MSTTGDGALERLGRALVLALGGVVALLVMSSLTTPTPSGVVLVAVAATVAALVGAARLGTPLRSPLVPLQRDARDVPALRTGRITDSPRHPRRPRAPGLV